MTYKPKDEQERIIHRLKIAKGHLAKVLAMVENHEYCIDTLHQSNAVQKSLREIDTVIMENHLKTCVSEDIKAGNTDETIAEIIAVLKNRA